MSRLEVIMSNAMRWRREVVGLVVSLAMLVLLTGARYRVRERETFASIADKFGVTEKSVRGANPGVKVLAANQIITVPEAAAAHRWTPSHPYAPPVPTVSDIVDGIASNRVAAKADDRPGFLVLYAGRGMDVPIGELRPRFVASEIVSHEVVLFAETGGGKRVAVRKPTRKGEPAAYSIGITDAFVPACRPERMENLLMKP